MFERFTDHARAVVKDARAEADRVGARTIEPEHLVLGLLAEGDGVGARVLADLGVTLGRARAAVEAAPGERERNDLDADALAALGIDLDAVRRRTEAAFGEGALSGPPAAGGRRWGRRDKTFSAQSKKVLELALRDALRLRHGYIGTEHLLLGLTATPRSRELLRRLDVEPQAVEPAVLQALRRAG